MEEFCSFYAYPASISYIPFYATSSFTISHILMFNSVDGYMQWHLYVYCITFVLASVYMSVFESPPHHSIMMDHLEQTYSIGSPDLREDALEDMLCRIHLQSYDPEFLKQEAERDQL